MQKLLVISEKFETFCFRREKDTVEENERRIVLVRGEGVF